MTDRKLPGTASRPPFLKEVPGKGQTSGDEDLLGGKATMVRSPLLWFVLLFIPVLMGLYAGFSRPSVTPQAKAPKAVSYTPDGFVAVPSPSWQESGRSTGRTIPVSCDFKEWLGKQADEAMQASLRAQKRAFRILPPGSVMTMDYSEDRVNFNVDPGGKITRVWCG